VIAVGAAGIRVMGFRNLRALAWAALLSAGGSVAAETTHTVIIDGMVFKPAQLTVQRGDRVVWENRDLLPHTATGADKIFDSQTIAPGASWTYTADQPGSYAYDCAFHPPMTGRLTVE
jgi:plastocyanin